MNDIQEAINHLNDILFDDVRWNDCALCKKEHIQLREWLMELHEYRKIGTVGECKDAREKRIKMNPIVLINDDDVKIGRITFKKGVKTYKCPNGHWISRGCKFCPECGQAIDWEDE